MTLSAQSSTREIADVGTPNLAQVEQTDPFMDWYLAQNFIRSSRDEDALASTQTSFSSHPDAQDQINRQRYMSPLLETHQSVLRNLYDASTSTSSRNDESHQEVYDEKKALHDIMKELLEEYEQEQMKRREKTAEKMRQMDEVVRQSEDEADLREHETLSGEDNKKEGMISSLRLKTHELQNELTEMKGTVSDENERIKDSLSQQKSKCQKELVEKLVAAEKVRREESKSGKSIINTYEVPHTELEEKLARLRQDTIEESQKQIWFDERESTLTTESTESEDLGPYPSDKCLVDDDVRLNRTDTRDLIYDDEAHIGARNSSNDVCTRPFYVKTGIVPECYNLAHMDELFVAEKEEHQEDIEETKNRELNSSRQNRIYQEERRLEEDQFYNLGYRHTEPHEYITGIEHDNNLLPNGEMIQTDSMVLQLQVTRQEDTENMGQDRGQEGQEGGGAEAGGGGGGGELSRFLRPPSPLAGLSSAHRDEEAATHSLLYQLQKEEKRIAAVVQSLELEEDLRSLKLSRLHEETQHAQERISDEEACAQKYELQIETLKASCERLHCEQEEARRAVAEMTHVVGNLRQEEAAYRRSLESMRDDHAEWESAIKKLKEHEATCRIEVENLCRQKAKVSSEMKQDMDTYTLFMKSIEVQKTLAMESMNDKKMECNAWRAESLKLEEKKHVRFSELCEEKEALERIKHEENVLRAQLIERMFQPKQLETKVGEKWKYNQDECVCLADDNEESTPRQEENAEVEMRIAERLRSEAQEQSARLKTMREEQDRIADLLISMSREESAYSVQLAVLREKEKEAFRNVERERGVKLTLQLEQETIRRELIEEKNEIMGRTVKKTVERHESAHGAGAPQGWTLEESDNVDGGVLRKTPAHMPTLMPTLTPLVDGGCSSSVIWQPCPPSKRDRCSLISGTYPHVPSYGPEKKDIIHYGAQPKIDGGKRHEKPILVNDAHGLLRNGEQKERLEALVEEEEEEEEEQQQQHTQEDREESGHDNDNLTRTGAPKNDLHDSTLKVMQFDLAKNVLEQLEDFMTHMRDRGEAGSRSGGHHEVVEEYPHPQNLLFENGYYQELMGKGSGHHEVVEYPHPQHTVLKNRYYQELMDKGSGHDEENEDILDDNNGRGGRYDGSIRNSAHDEENEVGQEKPTDESTRGTRGTRLTDNITKLMSAVEQHVINKKDLKETQYRI